MEKPSDVEGHVLTLFGREGHRHGRCSCGWNSVFHPSVDAVANEWRRHQRATGHQLELRAE